jgi:FkbM family methyltransferase
MPEYFSQFGEDKILEKIFPEKGCAVEVGAYDGRTGSNTLYFERRDWNCVLVEPNPELARTIRSFRVGRLFDCAVGARPGVVMLQIPIGAETLASVTAEPAHIERMARSSSQLETIEVRLRTLDDVLEEADVTKVDFITIDVEGYELDALRGFDLARWNPRIVILEDNSFGTDVAVPLYMEARGYIRFRSSGCNDWYCRATDDLLTRPSVLITESIKSLQAVKRITKAWIDRGWRRAWNSRRNF